MSVTNPLPSHVDESQLRADIQERLDTVELGPSIEAPSLRGLHHMVVSDERPADGPLTEVYIDAVAQLMFIKVTGSGFGDPSAAGPIWYGPLPIKDPAQR